MEVGVEVLDEQVGSRDELRSKRKLLMRVLRMGQGAEGRGCDDVFVQGCESETGCWGLGKRGSIL